MPDHIDAADDSLSEALGKLITASGEEDASGFRRALKQDFAARDYGAVARMLRITPEEAEKKAEELFAKFGTPEAEVAAAKEEVARLAAATGKNVTLADEKLLAALGVEPDPDLVALAPSSRGQAERTAKYSMPTEEAEPELCDVCGRYTAPYRGHEGDGLCRCSGIQPYAMSSYPGEYKLVKAHPDNEEQGEQFYKRRDVDPILRTSECPVESYKIIKAAFDIRNSGYDGHFIGEVVAPLFTALATYERVHMHSFTLIAPDPEYPEPTKEAMASPEFEAVWQAIKKWDISRYGSGGPGPTLYSGPTGNDAMHILKFLAPVFDAATRERDQVADRLAKLTAVLEKAGAPLGKSDDETLALWAATVAEATEAVQSERGKFATLATLGDTEAVSECVHPIRFNLPLARLAEGQTIEYRFNEPDKTDLLIDITIDQLIEETVVQRSRWERICDAVFNRSPVLEYAGSRFAFVLSLTSYAGGKVCVRPTIVEDSFVGKTKSPYTRRYHLVIGPEMRPGPYMLELTRIA